MTKHAQPTPEQEAVNGAYLLRKSVSEELAKCLLSGSDLDTTAWWMLRYQTAVAREQELEVICKATLDAARAEKN
jgi:hypothetical protein